MPRSLLRPTVLLTLALVAGVANACGGDENTDEPAVDGGTTQSADATASSSSGSSGSSSGSSSSSSGSSSGSSGSSSGSSGAEGGTDAGTDSAVLDAGFDAETPPAVKFIGRWDNTDPNLPKVAWSGARVIARFDGTQASASMKGVMQYSGLDYWDVMVDGTLTKTIALTTTMTSYDLTGVLPAGVHVVELFKRTEAYVGITHFGGFTFGNGGQLLGPPPMPNRRIEFLGDSSANGFGVDGAGPNCQNSPAVQNDHKAWPWLVAQSLGAEHVHLAYGGRGVYWNYTRSFPDVFKVIYPRVFPDTNGFPWAFASYTPDVVWITLGGNDWDQPNAGDPAPPFASFKAAYAELVGIVRGHYPNALIFLAVATSLNDFYPAGYNARTNMTNAVTQVKNESGDPNVFTFSFTPAQQADLTGCSYHPSPAKHAAMAAEATAFIKTKIAW